jgi:hypothetical protein
VKDFFRCRIPAYDRFLLIESGSRHLAEGVLPAIYQTYGENIVVDLVTCYSGVPSAFRSKQGAIYNVNEYAGPTGRERLLRELKSRRHTAMGIICSGEPIMTKWKWWLAAKLPVKFLILNENGDHFWFDRSNWRIIRHFILYRAGLSGAGAAGMLVRMAFFPFVVIYLILYATFVHVRRKVSL